uniref:jerky protein homolog-like n=1 Tax=Osmia lignaria TaxID=473952 RepID=UPI00147901AF|nr:jerky protein homolog-like [Osmia lignaria]
MADTSSTSSSASKQISITQKLDILNKLEAGASVKDLACEYNITDRSIRRIRQNTLSIRWFVQRRLLGDKITDNILLEKAKEFQEEGVGPSDFTPSRGWLWRFKKSYDLRLINMHGESADADKCAAERFIQQFPQILETNEISDDNLYNMDETSLFWKMLPNKTLASANENRMPGKKMKKDRITLALCANASGNHKLPVLFINKYENPRALKHCKNNLPVIYMHHKNSWMNRVLFQSWYENEFKPRVRKRQLQENSIGKVLSILDNFSGHKLSDEEMDDGYFQIMFLPPNTSSLIQPMD